MSRDLTDVLIAASVVFAPAIAGAVAVIFVIKQVHTVVQIIEERAAVDTRAAQRLIRLR